MTEGKKHLVVMVRNCYVESVFYYGDNPAVAMYCIVRELSDAGHVEPREGAMFKDLIDIITFLQEHGGDVPLNFNLTSEDGKGDELVLQWFPYD